MLDAASDPLLPVQNALEILKRQIRPLQRTEAVGLPSALGRILSEDLFSPRDLPETARSAMDGYSFRFDQLHLDRPTQQLRQTGSVLAGQPLIGEAGPTGAVRIMTGASLPHGHDTVIAQEQVDADSHPGQIIFSTQAISCGRNVRGCGEDLKVGDRVVKAGAAVSPQAIALLAALGIGSVQVYCRLRVAILSTGHELVDATQPATGHQVYDANRPMLSSLLQSLGAEVHDFGIVKDSLEALKPALSAAASSADVLITSGGVGAGDADHTRQALESLGDIHFWRLAIKPGRPVAAGLLPISHEHRSTVFFGLPGNPVAALVVFLAIAAPCLRLLSGAGQSAEDYFCARLRRATEKKPGRTEYLRCRLHQNPTGDWMADILPVQNASDLKSLALADGLVVLPHEASGLAAGSVVQVIPFSRHFLTA